jgi:hypothetical protein
MATPWSRKYPNCVSCGLADSPHSGHGLCRRCYTRNKNVQSNETYKRPDPGDILSPATRTKTLDYVIEQYVDKGKSLQDIATELKCTRQYIDKLLKQCEVKRRSRKDARDLAVAGGKLKYLHEVSPGKFINVKHTPLEIDRAFFNNWSDSLAYVLGFIYTDGNLIKSYFSKERAQYRDWYCVSISQKDSEILHQIRHALTLNRPVYKVKNNRVGYLHRLEFKDKEIFKQLEAIGLCANKSLTITFPEIPPQYLGGFVRGLFDGDGSYSGGEARLATGSGGFANGLKAALANEGFVSMIYMSPAGEKKKNPSYTVRIATRSDGLVKFYRFLYKDAKLFIARKRKTFEESLGELQPINTGDASKSKQAEYKRFLIEWLKMFDETPPSNAAHYEVITTFSNKLHDLEEAIGNLLESMTSLPEGDSRNRLLEEISSLDSIADVMRRTLDSII